MLKHKWVRASSFVSDIKKGLLTTLVACSVGGTEVSSSETAMFCDLWKPHNYSFLIEASLPGFSSKICLVDYSSMMVILSDGKFWTTNFHYTIRLGIWSYLSGNPACAGGGREGTLAGVPIGCIRNYIQKFVFFVCCSKLILVRNVLNIHDVAVMLQNSNRQYEKMME